MDKIDSFDLKILKLIQENNKITSEVLAKKVGLSSSACQRRINSMRKAGIIQKDVSYY
jgi:Lrp/AsnC family leucine-responsive transcriptional regulator